MEDIRGTENHPHTFFASHSEYEPTTETIDVFLSFTSGIDMPSAGTLGHLIAPKEILPPLGRDKYGIVKVGVSFSQTDPQIAPFVTPSIGQFSSAFEPYLGTPLELAFESQNSGNRGYIQFEWTEDLPEDEINAGYLIVTIEYDRLADLNAENDTPSHSDGTDDVTSQWVIESEGALSRPVVGDETIYVGTPTTIEAVDVEVGHRRWQRVLTETAVAPDPLEPTVRGNTLYVGDHGGTVHALDVETGEHRWRRDIGDPIFARPTLTDRETDAPQLVLVGTQAGTVCALAASDGTPQWQTAIDPVSYDLVTDNSILFPVATDGQEVYVSTNDGGLTVLDATTGEILRRLYAPGTDDMYSFEWGYHATPTVADGTVYYNIRFGLGAFDTQTGEQRWADRAKTSHNLVYAPVVAGDTVLATGPSAPVYALDRDTGELRWECGGYGSPPSVVDDTVYVTLGDAATAIDLDTGEVLWRYPTGVGHLTATEEGIYAVGRNDDGTSTLYALDETDTM
jgi:outer membrane protein assembly factor BamB